MLQRGEVRIASKRLLGRISLRSDEQRHMGRSHPSVFDLVPATKPSDGFRYEVTNSAIMGRSLPSVFDLVPATKPSDGFSRNSVSEFCT
jgi:hypothetical protein